MASSDYCLCDKCNRKVFYDANLGDDYFEDDYDIAVLCVECAKTHLAIVVPKDETREIERLRELSGNLECAYCGEIVGKVQGDGSDELLLRNHVSGCESHPLAEARIENATLRSRLEKAIEPDDLSERDYELIDGMIDVQRHHAERSLQMNNTVMGKKQHGWDMERVALLERIARLRGEG